MGRIIVHIFFLTLAYPLSGNGIYVDLFEELAERGCFITICAQDETRNSGPALISYRKNICIFSIPTGRITKTSILKKGINTLLLEYRFLKKISQIKFNSVDVLLYSTPPITFQKIIPWFKKKYDCISYLLLKDIFPQNAVDLGIIKKNGILYELFRNKEKKLYQHSDIIGCMSPANIKYLLENNYVLLTKKINITPNCMFPLKRALVRNNAVLGMHKIPHEKIKLIYGGNIGKPQGIDFIIKCLHVIKKYDNIFLTIVGDGTEFDKLRKSIDNSVLNIKLLNSLPTNAYRELLENMDAGLIFLDNKFSIPNFPSRILDFMNYSKPIIACTDIICDVKQEICDQGAGFWCRSDDIIEFIKIIEIIIKNKEILVEMGKKSRELFLKKFSVQVVVTDILREIADFNISKADIGD